MKHSSIDEYLSYLDIDQLKRAIKLADSKIQKIEEEGKVKILIVKDGCLNHTCHAIDDLDDAKNSLLELIKNDFSLNTSFGIFEGHCYRSELDDLLKLNKD